MNQNTKILGAVILGGVIARGIVYAITKKQRDEERARNKRILEHANEMSKKFVEEAFPTPNFKTES